MKHIHRLGISALLLNACSGGAADHAGRIAIDTVAVVDTIVSSDAELGGHIELAVAPAGRLYVADARMQRLVSVAQDGSDLRVIGRKGNGPGEFHTPWLIAVTGDSLRVWEANRRTIEVLHQDGTFGRRYQNASFALGPYGGFDREGRLLLSTAGGDSTLAEVYDSTGKLVKKVGELMGPRPDLWRFRDMKKRMVAGEIPWEWANSVTPIWGKDGSVFVAFDAKPEVRRYAPDGTLRWTVLLRDPVFESALATCIRRNTEDPHTNGIIKLRYIVDGELVDDELWLLLSTEDERDGAMLVLSAIDGAVRRRVVLRGAPGGEAFAFSPDRDRLYLADPYESQVLALDLRGRR